MTLRHYFLCLFARCSRYFAFWRADPLPCAPVIYCFFLALVFTLPLSFLLLLLALRNTIPPPAIMSSMSAIVKSKEC